MRVKGIININKCDLNLKMMLEGGQSFRWKSSGDNSWTGVIGNLIWNLKQDDSLLAYEAFRDGPKEISDDLVEESLKNYLRLDAPLAEYYEKWSKCDENFANVAAHCYGIRMLKQDPVENVFSFICSSNNNISRITSMIEKMCDLYGDELGEGYHSFPSIDKLSEEGVEAALRKLGFGYRAKYIAQSANHLQGLGGSSWLQSLSKGSYSEAKTAMLQLPGVGPKVADCICLMSLGFFEALPVDTHVFQIAMRWYMPELARYKSFQPSSVSLYNSIGDRFRVIYGPLAGWAHTVLFCGDLKKFSSKDVPTTRTSRGEKRKHSKVNDDG